LTPIVLSKSSFGVYFLFGGLALGTVIVLALFMPETKGKSLESIQLAFERPLIRSWSLGNVRRRIGQAPLAIDVRD
jgi:hypothetical protein